MKGDGAFLFEHDNSQTRESRCKLHCGREAHNASADNRYIVGCSQKLLLQYCHNEYSFVAIQFRRYTLYTRIVKRSSAGWRPLIFIVLLAIVIRCREAWRSPTP